MVGADSVARRRAGRSVSGGRNLLCTASRLSMLAQAALGAAQAGAARNSAAITELTQTTAGRKTMKMGSLPRAKPVVTMR
jgi:hypothetical protein